MTGCVPPSRPLRTGRDTNGGYHLAQRVEGANNGTHWYSRMTAVPEAVETDQKLTCELVNPSVRTLGVLARWLSRYVLGSQAIRLYQGRHQHLGGADSGGTAEAVLPCGLGRARLVARRLPTRVPLRKINADNTPLTKECSHCKFAYFRWFECFSDCSWRTGYRSSNQRSSSGNTKGPPWLEHLVKAAVSWNISSYTKPDPVIEGESEPSLCFVG